MKAHSTTSRKFKVFIITLFMFSSLRAFYEFELPSTILRVKADAEATNQSKVDSGARTYEDKIYSLKANIPVYSYTSHSEYFTLIKGFANPVFKAYQPSLQGFNKNNFYHARLFASAIGITRDREFYLAKLGLGLSESADSINFMKIQPYAVLLGTLHINDGIQAVYGATLSNRDGDAKPFPLLGFRYDYFGKYKILIILPALIKFTYNVSDRLKASVHLTTFGNKFRYDNPLVTTGKNSDGYFMHKGAKFGLKSEYHYSHKLLFGGELGVKLNNKFSYDETTGATKSFSGGRATYLKVFARYVFGFADKDVFDYVRSF